LHKFNLRNAVTNCFYPCFKLVGARADIGPLTMQYGLP